MVDIENVLMIDVTLKCTACRNKSNYCECEEPNLVWDTFGFLLGKQDNTPIYITIKDFDLLCSLLDVTPSEQEMTMQYVRQFGEFKVFNDAVNSKCYEIKKIFSFFNKISSKKAVYGAFASKKDKVKGMDDSIVPGYIANQASQLDASSYLFANGTIKSGNKMANLNHDDTSPQIDNRPAFILTYHIIAQHCERIAPVSIANLLFKSILSQL